MAARREAIRTAGAPAAIGPYSQAMRAGPWVWLSGQIPLEPATMELVSDDVDVQIEQVFDNLEAVAQAADGDLSALVKLTVYLLDLDNFQRVNAVMERRLAEPYPARAAVGVAALPRNAQVEIEGVMLAPER